MSAATYIDDSYKAKKIEMIAVAIIIPQSVL